MVNTNLFCSLVIAASLASAKALQVALVIENTKYYVDTSAFNPGYDLNLKELRLVQLHPNEEPVWWSELEKVVPHPSESAWRQFYGYHGYEGSRYHPDTEASAETLYANALSRRDSSLYAADVPGIASYPSPHLMPSIKPILKNFTTTELEVNLKKFSSFRTRYYRSETGRESQQWLLAKIKDITDTSAAKSIRDSITISEFKHSWGQNTVVARIDGTGPKNQTLVIVGAHQDSTNMWPFLPAPGAGDDGSGTVAILQAYRGLIAAGFKPERTVEFHWYSAEEGGLLGSRAVVADYESRRVDVYAMSHFDMAAWFKDGTAETIGILTDYTDPDLTEFCKELVDAYLDVPWTETKCGYACSDHGSWTAAGFPSSSMMEGKFEDTNPHIHSTNDRIDISTEFSFPHMMLFSKLAAAFVAETAGWSED